MISTATFTIRCAICSFYRAPVPSLLVDYKSKTEIDEREILENKEKIRETLQNFGIPIVNMHATVGPTVTLYRNGAGAGCQDI